MLIGCLHPNLEDVNCVSILVEIIEEVGHHRNFLFAPNSLLESLFDRDDPWDPAMVSMLAIL